jgi:hypothetical protein
MPWDYLIESLEVREAILFTLKLGLVAGSTEAEEVFSLYKCPTLQINSITTKAEKQGRVGLSSKAQKQVLSMIESMDSVPSTHTKKVRNRAQMAFEHGPFLNLWKRPLRSRVG